MTQGCVLTGDLQAGVDGGRAPDHGRGVPPVHQVGLCVLCFPVNHRDAQSQALSESLGPRESRRWVTATQSGCCSCLQRSITGTQKMKFPKRLVKKENKTTSASGNQGQSVENPHDTCPPAGPVGTQPASEPVLYASSPP